MALTIKNSIPTAHGFELSNLYMMVDAQYSRTTEDVLEFNCVFYASKQARGEGKDPIKIGNHPLASLSNGMKFKLSEVVTQFQLPEPKTIQSGLEIFGLLQQTYYSLVVNAINEINQTTGVNIEFEPAQ